MIRKLAPSIGLSILAATVIPSPAPSQPVSFIAARDFDVGEQPASIAVADFNRDGVPDLAVVVSTPPPAGAEGIAILFGLGGGTFGSPEIIFRAPAAALGLVTGDFNGDGIADLAVVANAPFSGPGSVVGLLGNGDGTFGQPSRFPAGTSSPSRGIAAGAC